MSYDANGNTTADGSGNTYVYDAWNRLVAVKTSGGTTIAAYGYNGLGERVTETHGATTTDLYYSAAWQVLEERVGGALQARNAWSPVYVDALSAARPVEPGQRHPGPTPVRADGRQLERDGAGGRQRQRGRTLRLYSLRHRHGTDPILGRGDRVPTAGFTSSRASGTMGR